MRISDWSSDVCSSDLLQVFFQNRPAIRIGGFHGSGNYEYVLQGDNFEALGKAASTLQKAMEGVAGLRDINSDLELNNPQIDVHIERDRAADLHVSVADIQSTLYAAYGRSEERSVGKEGVRKCRSRGSRY